MVFTSPTFLFIFLPLVLAGYYLLYLPVRKSRHPHFWRRASNLFLLLSSLAFYFWGENLLIWVMTSSIFVDYFAALYLERVSGRKRVWGLVISLAANLGLLAYFKYANFGVDTAIALLSRLGASGSALESFAEITLPLGISFYTFQSMSYTIDVYRREVKATRNFIDFACFVTLFPQLVAGPIVRYRHVAEQIRTRSPDLHQFASGVMRFIIGLGKKMLIANPVALCADAIFALPPGECSTLMAWAGTLAYTFQIYFDFSGYSDMAIGLGRMFGFDFNENFNYPYIAHNMRDFWRRWHISLSSWFRDYLYIPLGGNRGGAARTCFNLFVVFFLCGLWHGASWNFIAWGLFHGLFLSLERLLSKTRFWRLPQPLLHIYTLLVAMVAWVLFRAETLTDALGYLKAMFLFTPTTAESLVWTEWMPWPAIVAMIAAIPLSTPLLPRLFHHASRCKEEEPLNGLASAGLLAFLSLVLLLVFIQIAQGTHNPFLYFRF